MNSDVRYMEFKETLKGLNTNEQKKWIGINSSPHKPILLISLISLHKHNKINLRHIKPSDKNLLEVWKRLWRCLGYKDDPDKKKSEKGIGKIRTPFSALLNDGDFWKKTGRGVYSFSDDFIFWLNDEDKRKEIEICLFNSKYFLHSQVNTLKNELKKIDEWLESL